MKTAISVPDETFERVSRRARELQMSRSEFFSRAATCYLDALDARSVTEQIDAALEGAGKGDPSSVDAVSVGRRIVATGSDAW